MVTWFHRGSGFSEQHSRGGELRVFSLRDAVQVFAGQWKVGGSIFGTRACVHGGDDGDADDGDDDGGDYGDDGDYYGDDGDGESMMVT